MQSSPPAPCGASFHLYVHTVRPHLPHGGLLLPLQLGYRPIQIQFVETQEVKPLRPPCPFKQTKSKKYQRCSEYNRGPATPFDIPSIPNTLLHNTKNGRKKEKEKGQKKTPRKTKGKYIQDWSKPYVYSSSQLMLGAQG
jgi:hypothetical protein